MSKLKLYNHSKESRAELEQDLAETLSSLEALGEALAISLFGKLTKDSLPNVKNNFQLIKEQYSKPFQELASSEEDLLAKLEKFDKFSKFIDKKFVIND